MSPKKKRARRPARPATPPTRPNGRPAQPDRPVRVDPARLPAVSRTPVVVEERRRWPLVVWPGLGFAWLVGTALFGVLWLAEGVQLLTMAEVTAAARRTAAWYLVWMLVCALLVPLAGAALALRTRRRAAAAFFGLALLLSVAGLWLLAPPSEYAGALAGAFSS
ncbi:hypothetical protein [Marinitenerispora sediminis]|uniref:Uncharacterized protein n=1 Tax=Marinitenerispora sediminis TaxID=1931232 RepID=A0A368SZD1_9ACTN|nr:hypothetical protein [Marinitenerispora sediminis]RCV48032.1 hypothetical protein DEF28_24645 [Marinitenerispora sediminis]RCV49075.1 hypothetical protein DEF23_24130 [Marinitenerispora sediminis]RCV51171.1 hypothetical protein DEF24_23460 [Marinitenerispora sediminis]